MFTNFKNALISKILSGLRELQGQKLDEEEKKEEKQASYRKKATKKPTEKMGELPDSSILFRKNATDSLIGSTLDIAAQIKTSANQAVKTIKSEVLTMLTDHIRDYLRDSKNFKEALSMANKSGLLINDF